MIKTEQPVSRLGTCQACVHSRMTDQMGTIGLLCHESSAGLFVMPVGPGQVKIFGLYPPVATDGGCSKFSPARADA